MKNVIGIIGGSGLYSLNDNKNQDSTSIKTPFNEQSVLIYAEIITGQKIFFLPRHGQEHKVPPHLVNYRANLWALKESGVNKIISVNVVGGISEKMQPGAIVLPDQIIDYTWGREHTFFSELESTENHVDFTWPYDQIIGNALVKSASFHQLPVIQGAVYGCTQGPRLESAAEIRKMKDDGCDIVGMTAMPEAALARELDISYASIALIVNCGAGLTNKVISFAAINEIINTGMGKIVKIVSTAIDDLS